MAEYHTDDNRTTGFLTGCWNRLRRLWYSPASGGKPSGRKALGDAGEHAAAKLYRRQGSRVLERNYTCKRGEIDIIALDRDVVCFIEVKTRRPNSLLPPDCATRYAGSTSPPSPIPSKARPKSKSSKTHSEPAKNTSVLLYEISCMFCARVSRTCRTCRTSSLRFLCVPQRPLR